MSLSLDAVTDLHWWQRNLPSLFAPIHWPPITTELATDASLIAWGASYGKLAIGGAWTGCEATIHINVKEMTAIYYALRSFVDLIKGAHIRVLCDNTTAVSVLNKMGSTRSPACNNMAQQIWLFCKQH